MNADVIIIGAGAAGLMAARELGKAGKKVLILEARDRIGGRIMPLGAEEFGYPAEGGAEWLHGDALITKALVEEAGLTLVREDGEIWSARSGELAPHASFIEGNTSLKEKLLALKEDMPVLDFLKQFPDKEDADFKNSIIKMVEGYESADPAQMSTFALRQGWLSHLEMMEIADDHRLLEGYGALINYLRNECEKYGTTIMLGAEVKSIATEASVVSVTLADGRNYIAEKAVLTVPLPILLDIALASGFAEKKEVIAKIGFGNAIKVLIQFKTRWWEQIEGKDLSRMAFMLTNEKFLTWWTQYPKITTVLTGWMAGPNAHAHASASSEELLDLALTALSNTLKISKDTLKGEIIHSRVFNWPHDPFARGSYSYTAFDTEDARERVAEPYENKVYFAGEALFSGDATSTVEGALGSGLEVAQKILGQNPA